MNTDAFDLQEKKREGHILCFDILYTLILADDIVNYLSFVILNDSLLK